MRVVRYLLAVALLASCIGVPARAEETVEQYCARVVANADKGKAQAFEAGLLYFHGKHMGKACVKVDYIRAFELLQKAGASRDAQSLLNMLTDRANTGSPRAQAALRELQKRGWIEEKVSQ
jgi:ABC-type hemin transport system substrate-binding protein